MIRFYPFIVAALSGLFLANVNSSELFDHEKIRDASTLDIQVIKDWHEVSGPVATRQKDINILVLELIPGKPYRIPVRLIVPKDQKAKGFHLTGGHRLKEFEREGILSRPDQVLLSGGVGLVHTMIQDLAHSDQKVVGDALETKFIETLDPRFSIAYYGWPLTLMKAITAAYAETEYFEVGKIAMSGASKNGATPSVVLIADDRTTAVHAAVSPIWGSPLRLCDEKAWEELRSFNTQYLGGSGRRGFDHPFLGGTYGPIYNRKALTKGHSWADLTGLAEAMADHVFITRNLDALQKRGVDMMFHPGTHDFVCFDIAWGGAHHPEIPLFLQPNSGHGIRPPHPQAASRNQNLGVFLFQHFFDDCEERLRPPVISSERKENVLSVSAHFTDDVQAESGRIWWLYDRGPDGSEAYLRDRFQDEDWAEMKLDATTGKWTAEIPVEEGHKTIDFLANFSKVLEYRGEALRTEISSPYQRVALK